MRDRTICRQVPAARWASPSNHRGTETDVGRTLPDGPTNGLFRDSCFACDVGLSGREIAGDGRPVGQTRPTTCWATRQKLRGRDGPFAQFDEAGVGGEGEGQILNLRFTIYDRPRQDSAMAVVANYDQQSRLV